MIEQAEARSVGADPPDDPGPDRRRADDIPRAARRMVGRLQRAARLPVTLRSGSIVALSDRIARPIEFDLPSWHRLPDALLAVLLASRCAVCDQLLEEPTRGAVCPACWAAVKSFSPPLCQTCSDPLPSWRTISHQRMQCPRCRRRPRAVDRSRALGPYEGTLRRIIHAFKYEGRRSIAAQLAGLMLHQAADLLDGADCAVPVPLHWSRRRARGFNQAADLARHLGLPVVNSLRRAARTVSQTDLPAGRRHANVRGAFAAGRPRGYRLRHPASGPPRFDCVVLVDDVSTTGATLEACARILKAEGVREVRAVTAARVVTPRR